jgi:hypothetical protein
MRFVKSFTLKIVFTDNNLLADCVIDKDCCTLYKFKSIVRLLIGQAGI